MIDELTFPLIVLGLILAGVVATRSATVRALLTGVDADPEDAPRW